MTNRAEEIKQRTKRLAIEAIRFSRRLPNGIEYQVIKRQLIRSACSVGADYRAACRGRSVRDFISRISIVAEESDEVQYWLEIIEELGGVGHPKLRELQREADELTAIMVASINTARSRKAS